jgi:hypothetical protein
VAGTAAEGQGIALGRDPSLAEDRAFAVGVRKPWHGADSIVLGLGPVAVLQAPHRPASSKAPST